MAEKEEPKAVAARNRGWPAIETLRQEVDRLFEDFPYGLMRPQARHKPWDVEPFWQRQWGWGAVPAVDIVEKDGGYEITAELPGIDEKNIEVKYADGVVTIRGEKEEKKEEKKKDYQLCERRYGSFRRAFALPAGVDADKIEATFAKGVLTVTVPKSSEAVKREKTIAVKAK
jgi:HSP20 family protein